jgi:putative tricarboxylic transport membrane protein
MAAMTTGRSLRLDEMVLVGGVLALDLFIAVETAMLEVAPSQAAVDPKLFPSLVAAGLLLVGAALLREAFFGHIAHEGGFELDWLAAGLVSAGLVL